MPIKINGQTSGSVTLSAPATGSDVTLSLPGTNFDLAAIPQANVTNLTTDLASKLDLAGGKILQVVQSSHATLVTVASTSYTDTGLSASIAPSSATSKVLIIVSQNMGVYRLATGVQSRLQIVRDSTSIIDYGNCIQLNAGLGSDSTTEMSGSLSFTYLDSPATTSAITYKTQGRANATSSGGAAFYQYSDSPSYITLMEVSA